MDELRLCYPVHTLEGLQLCPAGTTLSSDTIETLIHQIKEEPPQTHPLLSYGEVKRDLLRQMARPPYDTIFSDQQEIAAIMTIVEKVSLPLPALQSLDHFKEHDYHTYCHALMVCALSTLIARDINADYTGWIRQASAGPTHDIGKICIPLDILKKKTPVTRAERDILDHHTAAGYVLLSYFHADSENHSAIVARDHHERRDGSGKPLGRRITDPLTDIIIVCDVYDALISPRPYRHECYDNRAAIEEITKMAENNKIGWEVVRVLVAHNRKNKPAYRETDVSTEKRGASPSDNFYGVIEDNDDNAH
jgi:HD-GYP domain-containing protein (c-di-GMP phosphodiesterase class II)